MTVDPEVRALLDAFDDGSPFDLARARAALDDLSLAIAAPGRPPTPATASWPASTSAPTTGTATAVSR